MAYNLLSCERDQSYLMPPSMRDWLSEGHLAWFIVDAVGQMDLREFYAVYRSDGWGAAAYDPGMMVAILLYGYCVGVRSSRRISLYYQPVGVSQEGLELMKLLDKQYLERPFFGSRRMAIWLRGQGYRINRKRVGRLMGAMGLRAIYRRPRTSKPGLGHRVYPYLLRSMRITRPNPGVGSRYNLRAHGQRFHVPGSHHGLAQSVRARLASFQYTGRRLLCQGSGGGS